MEKFYTCKEIAERYRVQRETVWEWIRTGKLKAVRYGKRYLISQQDIDAFEATNAS